jgi:hypothetical protein
VAQPNEVKLVFPDAFFTPGMRLDQLVRGEPYKRDVRTVLGIPADEFEKANVALEQAPGAIGRNRLLELVSPILGEASQAFANFAWHFHSVKAEFPNADMVQEIERRTTKLFTDDHSVVADLAPRLRRLMQRKAGLELQAKVRTVAVRTGNRLSELTLTSDLRPVMDGPGDSVEAMLPITTLRLGVLTDNGAKTLEARLSEKELARLEEEVARARTKLAALKAFVRKSGIPLPESDLLEDEQ